MSSASFRTCSTNSSRSIPTLACCRASTIVVRADAEALAARGEVALISGGGSRARARPRGIRGPGMLSAAVAGEVFTSPTRRRARRDPRGDRPPGRC